ncbi:hypothetical protein HBP98_16835 [Listeria booriae]|uniref:Uncharacterized protein n=1 Tax=Listeria booriae TaxID=1552123 RepID=A0A7X1A9C7_9LIST|nr:hypothetical protein [Listeria booriae]MBC2373679.1 hypothetical protein [Listeria booriae]
MKMEKLTPQQVKETLAQNVTAKIKELTRGIEVDYTLDYEVGDIITVESAESWSNDGLFTVENIKEYPYSFNINNEAPCHVLDYSDDEICHMLGATDCEHEKEVIIAKGTKFRVTDVSTDDDFAEMGFYKVELEYIEED